MMRNKNNIFTLLWVLLFSSTNSVSMKDEISSYLLPKDEEATCHSAASDFCTTMSGPAANVPCVFPVLVGNQLIFTCTRDGGFNDPWCPTEVDPSDCELLPFKWGNCDPETCGDIYDPTTTHLPVPSTTEITHPPTTSACSNTNSDCLTIGGEEPNVPCWFPFISDGIIYTTCTTHGGFVEPWCATMVDHDCNIVVNHWGNCDPETCPDDSYTTTTVNPTTETTEAPTTEAPTTEAPTTEAPTTEEPTTETTEAPIPGDCWYDYLCSTMTIIGEGADEDSLNASICQTACKDYSGCNHFTWIEFHGVPKCYFVEDCIKEPTCSSPDHCKSGPSDCEDLPVTCNQLEYTPGDDKIHWVALDDINPYFEPIPQGTTCITSDTCESWKNPSGPVAEVMATCNGGTRWTLVPNDVTYADGTQFPKPSQGDPDCFIS